MNNRNWIVLIIGGASGTGKSEIAYKIARHYGINVLEFDDIHCAVKPFATEENHPALFDKDGHDWMNLGVERNVNWLKDVSRELADTLKRLVDRHTEDNLPVIIEGDFILPESVKQLLTPSVKALFVQETDINQIIRNYQSRESGEPQTYRSEICVSYNDYIRKSCNELGVAMLESRPWDTALQRTIELLEN